MILITMIIIPVHGLFLPICSRRVAKQYLSKWFWVDLISVFPLNFILGSWAEVTTLFKLLRVIRLAKIFRLLKVYRMLRVIRLPAFIETIEMNVDKSLINIGVAIFIVILALHLAGCLFYYMAYLDGLSPATWVGVAGIENASLWTKYLYSLYWSSTTLTTVGYGDIVPHTVAERLVTIPLMLLGECWRLMLLGDWAGVMPA
jgi:hypothetical protein